MIKPWRRRWTPSGTTGRRPDLEQQLQTARRELRRARRRLATVRGELRRLRTFTLDVFPELSIPVPVRSVIDGVRAENLTYLTGPHLESLVGCVLETESAGREGRIIEAGTALGGSAIAMAAAKSAGRPMWVYDTFGMIPPPTEKDGADVHDRYGKIREGRSSGLGGDTYYGYREDLLAEVTESFARHGVPVGPTNVTLVQGLFADTLVVDGPVALAHLDGDWYESTMTCLTRIAPMLVPGGRIVVDDYFAWSGCRSAVDEYFADRPEFRVEMRAKVHVVRQPTTRLVE